MPERVARIMDRPTALVIVVFSLFAGLFACSKAENVSARRQPKQEVRHAGKLRVDILPEAPSAADDLQSVYFGDGSVTYCWEKNGKVLDGEQGPRLAKKNFSRGDDITVIVKSDNEEGRASLTIGNAPPLVMSVSFSPENICRGVDIIAVPVGNDADGDSIRYSFKWLVNGKEMGEDTPILKGDRINCGDRVSVKITPYDSYAAGKEYATQAIVIPKALPYFISTPPVTFNDNVYSYDVKASDPDGDAISYALVSAPAGMTINGSTGRVEWRVARQPGTYAIEIEAKNSKGLTARQKYDLAVTVP